MNLQHHFPELRILPIRSLRPHEDHDPQRLEPLIERLGQEGRLKNPPLVLDLDEGEGFLLLDGANRSAALAALGYEMVLAQVVRPERDHVHLQTWNRKIGRAHV